jgi:uncharacterized membrane protein
MLILAWAVAVGCVAGITLKEEKLANAFVGIDAAIGAGAVAEFQSKMPFPESAFTMRPLPSWPVAWQWSR